MPRCQVREPRQKGKSIAQRSQRPQRGIGPVDESSVVNASASGARTTQKGEKHRTEVTEATEGIEPVDSECLGVRCEPRKGKHRPELLTGPAFPIELLATNGHFRRVFLALKSRASI
jgi:hypothetical protein